MLGSVTQQNSVSLKGSVPFVRAMKPKSLEWRLARLRYIRSVKDQLPIEFRKDIERAEQALVKAALEEQPTKRHPSLRVDDAFDDLGKELGRVLINRDW